LICEGERRREVPLSDFGLPLLFGLSPRTGIVRYAFRPLCVSTYNG